MIAIGVKYLRAVKERFFHILQNTRTSGSILLEKLYFLLETNTKAVLVISFLTSVCFGILKTVFFTGYNVDSYQYYALALEKWIISGEQNALLSEYSARYRIIYPLLISLVHILIPLDISILACVINLIFGLGSVMLIRDLLRLRNFNHFELELCTILLVLSYNFLNYWFDIITDMIALFFFLLTLRYFELYNKNEKPLHLCLSIISLLLSVLCREVYVLGILLYPEVVKPKIAKVLAISIILVIVTFVMIFLGEFALMFRNYFPESAWDALENGNFINALFLLESKWLDIIFLQNFVKGLIKVSIIPVLAALILLFYLRHEMTLDSLISKFKKIDYVGIWFILFSVAFILLFSSTRAASGLRYWLPISWIPIIAIVHDVSRDSENRAFKAIIVILLMLYPIMWSSAEWYINRNAPKGTGPLYKQNYYFNDMNDVASIEGYNPDFMTIQLTNDSFFNTTLLQASYTDGLGYSSFGFAIWINMTNGAVIRLRLLSKNDAQFMIHCHEVKKAFADGWGDVKYSISDLDSTSYFSEYEFIIEEPFLLRYIALSVTGSPGAQILWDYLEIVAF